MNQHRRHATMAVERGLESLTADRLRDPGDQPQLAGVLRPILPVAAQLRQKGGWIGSVVPLDPVGDRTRLFLAQLDRGPRRDRPQIGFPALPAPWEINQDRIAKFELTTVDNRPSSLVCPRGRSNRRAPASARRETWPGSAAAPRSSEAREPGTIARPPWSHPRRRSLARC